MLYAQIYINSSWHEHKTGCLIKKSVSNTGREMHPTLQSDSSLINIEHEFFIEKVNQVLLLSHKQQT